MAETNLTFSKIVSFPKPDKWSQIYNAGQLFVVLSLGKKGNELEEESDSLNQIGKNVLDRLEKEFFSIENKNLESIRPVFEATLKNIPEEINSSMALAYFSDGVLYLFSTGGSKIFIKRGSKFGTILESQELENRSISSSSGPVQDSDTILLSTKSFSDIVEPSTISSSLTNNSPEGVSESLMPKVHEKENGEASAIIVQYQKQEVDISTEDQETDEPEINDPTQEQEEKEEKPEKTENKIPISFPKETLNGVKLGRKKRTYLTIAVIITILLISSIFFAVKKQSESRIQELFEEIHPVALEKYEQGNSLIDLNSNLAKESLIAAKKSIDENIDEFSIGSEQEKQISELLKKIEDDLKKIEESGGDKSAFLKAQAGNPNTEYFSEDENYVYMLNDEGITSIDKDSNSEELLINSSEWENPVTFDTYIENFYVADADSGQILKFVDEGDGYDKSDYFNDSQLNLSSAISMAIDGSIWILYKNGDIQKFIRGTEDAFEVSGLDTDFSNPTRIYTNSDIDNLYILDNGNSRVVALNKDGDFITEYSHESIKNAKDFDVRERENIIYILSGNKIHEINLN